MRRESDVETRTDPGFPEPNREARAALVAAFRLAGEDRDAFLDGVCVDENERRQIEAWLEDTGGPSVAPERHPERIGDFNIVRELGHGGMGVVYLARETALDRFVALKVIAGHLLDSPEAVKRFENEARSAARVSHPGIVPVFRFESRGDRHYIVSEFVDGPTLDDVIRDENHRRRRVDGSGSVREWHDWCIETVASLADALDAAHEAGVLHGDIKPSNVLIDPRIGPRLTDFGIAERLVEGRTTPAAGVLGSVPYVCPERLSDEAEPLDGRSDVYSLGTVLYELLTLRRPFYGLEEKPKPEAVLERIAAGTVVPVRSVDRRIPRDLALICTVATSRDPDQRYQTAGQLAAELRAHRRGHPLMTRPEGPFRRAARWCAAHQRPIVALVLVALLGVLVVTGLSLRHIRDSTKAWIEVTLPEGTNEVSLYAQDPESLHFDDVARSAGLAESGLLAVDPGVYRLRVMRTEDHMWCEVDLVLLTPGRDHAGRVVVTDEPTRASAGRDTINAVLVAPDADVSDMLLVAGAGAFGVAPFLIDRTEVSNADYRAFVDATGYPEPSHWRFIDDFEAAAALPVVMVSFHDACAYARWRGKRLPTWAEWQAGARGDSANVYPPRFDLEKHAIGMTAVPASPITVYLDRFLTSVRPTNEPAPWDDPNGVLHTFSNVRELTSSIDQANVDLRIAGRAWTDATTGMTLADFTTHPLYTISGEPAGGPRVGFRCARSLP